MAGAAEVQYVRKESTVEHGKSPLGEPTVSVVNWEYRKQITE